jgi:3-phenylpropionate/trans-cinnamate dioxygenase ferredoxin reductase subunit
MMSSEDIVIIGAGQAGGELAAALRSLGYDAGLTLVGDEASYPYARPPLSKAYLLGKCSAEELLIRAPAMYDQQNINVRMNIAARSIDRKAKTVTLSNGEALSYSKLVIATGGRPRHLPVRELSGAANVFYVRTRADIDRMRPYFVPGSRLATIGGGFIGLEVASVARQLGLDVTLLESQQRLLARATCPLLSEFFRRVHHEEGVDVRLQTSIQSYVMGRSGNVEALLLNGGERIDVDIVLVGIGLVPNTALAEAAGLEVENGIIVDECLRTSDPAIYAIGDVARFPDAGNGALRRIESVPNATEQARTVAETLLGRPRPYIGLPWFWSDQYDVKLQIVGLWGEHDQVVPRGDLTTGRKFAIYYLRNGVVSAADIVGSPQDFAVARKLVAAAAVVDPVILADTRITPRDLFRMVAAVA